MKTKENIDSKSLRLEKPLQTPKPRSLRPMRSMVAVRSLKPRTQVAGPILKEEAHQNG